MKTDPMSPGDYADYPRAWQNRLGNNRRRSGPEEPRPPSQHVIKCVGKERPILSLPSYATMAKQQRLRFGSAARQRNHIRFSHSKILSEQRIWARGVPQLCLLKYSLERRP
jgi:hypothetical protein